MPRIIVVIPLTVPTEDWPNQPAGFTRFFEFDFETIPPNGAGDKCNFAGLLDGCAQTFFASTPDLSIVSVSDSPKSPPEVLQIRYIDGLADGDGPDLWQGWDTENETDSTQFKEVYVSFWVRTRDATFETRGGFRSDWDVEFRQQQPVNRSMAQNVNTTRLFTSGTWHRMEVHVVLNDIGVANGKLKWWIDGILALDYSDITFRDATDSTGFHAWRWDPVWGGGGFVKMFGFLGVARTGKVPNEITLGIVGGPGSVLVKTRDDFTQIAHFYASGILL